MFDLRNEQNRNETSFQKDPCSAYRWATWKSPWTTLPEGMKPYYRTISWNLASRKLWDCGEEMWRIEQPENFWEPTSAGGQSPKLRVACLTLGRLLKWRDNMWSQNADQMLGVAISIWEPISKVLHIASPASIVWFFQKITQMGILNAYHVGTVRNDVASGSWDRTPQLQVRI